MTEADALRAQLEPYPGFSVIDSADGLPIIVIEHAGLRASITPQGAQLLEFQPAGQPPLLWCSAQARYQPGKAVRGGIPLCWPWFGPHPGDATQPAHGFARVLPWQLAQVEVAADSVSVAFVLRDSAVCRAIWPHAFELSLCYRLGRELQLDFSVTNRGTTPAGMSYALHSYFPVSDIADTAVDGLDGVSYIDQLDAMARKLQHGAVRFADEVDRMYVGAGGDYLIHDQAGGRRIHLQAHGCASAVVWNPWIDKARRLADMGDDEYRQMLCVECGNVADDTLMLAPGASHHARLAISGAAG
ncbi:D-hexose-6-phosphate mutarotase [Chitinivorax sp. PXF-14]|uniref:D-hexose-6-phosphate mutarotase n=1 Tax=Chitinivorax sp. PXF-14 TaxID=3230488 RepID=UPI0034658792